MSKPTLKECWANIMDDIRSDLETIGEMVERVDGGGDSLADDQSTIAFARKELIASFKSYMKEFEELLWEYQAIIDEGEERADDIAETNRSMPQGRD